MPTLQTIRNRLISDLGIGLTLNSIDSLTTTSATNDLYFHNTNWDSNQYFNWLMHRPDAVNAADVYRYVASLNSATGALTHSGANYVDTTATAETFNLLEPGVRPDQDIDPAINRALEYVYWQTMEPLSLAADACMRETAFASWGTQVNGTKAKVTTASKVYTGMGIKAAEITNTSANGYLPTANIPVVPGEMIFVATLSKGNSAGAIAKQVIFDVTNSATFGSSTQHSELTWEYMQAIEQVPAGCHNINVRLQGVGASDVIDWQALWVIRSSILRYNLPSYADERFKVDSIGILGFMRSNPNGTGIVFEGMSANPMDLPKDEYSTDFPMPEANPTSVQFHPQTWQMMWARRFGPRYGPGTTAYFPLVLQMRLPYSEQGTLTTETSTTACPLHLIVPASEVQLLSASMAAQKNSTKSLADVTTAFFAAQSIRATKGPSRPKISWAMPRLSN